MVLNWAQYKHILTATIDGPGAWADCRRSTD